MLLSAAAIAIAGGIKTAAGGGGYGSLQLLLNENYGLYEGSIMSAVGISIIPLILWYRRHGTIFPPDWRVRSEEHTSELQSLMRISYAVFCLKKKNNKHQRNSLTTSASFLSPTLTLYTIY